MRRSKKRFNVNLGKSQWITMNEEWFLLPSISFHTYKGEGYIDGWHHVTDYSITITFAFLNLHIYLTVQYFTKWFSPYDSPF